MRGRFWSLLKGAISIVANFCFIYPVILLARASLFMDTVGVPGFLAGLTIIFAGYIITCLVVRDRPNTLRLVISYSLSFIPGLLLFLLFLNAGNIPPNSVDSVLRGVFEGAAAFVLYYMGARSAVMSFDSMLARKTVTIGGIILIGAIIFTGYYEELEYLKNGIYYLGCVFTVLVLLVKNQQNLDKVFIKKHIELSMVPKDIRRYNSIIILVVFMAILALFNIKVIVDFIVMVLGKTPRYILMALIYILHLLSKIMPGGEGTGEPKQEEPEMPALPEGESNSITDIILTIVFGLIFLVIIILLLSKSPGLLRAIGEKLVKICKKIGAFIRKLFGLQREYGEKEGDYVDEVEIIKPAPKSKRQGKQKGILRIIGRKLGRNLTLVEKVRFLYAGILHTIRTKGIVLLKSDTTGEILKKLPGDKGLGEMMGYVTEVYDKVRYGEKTVDSLEFDCYREKAGQVVDMLKFRP